MRLTSSDLNCSVCSSWPINSAQCRSAEARGTPARRLERMGQMSEMLRELKAGMDQLRRWTR